MTILKGNILSLNLNHIVSVELINSNCYLEQLKVKLECYAFYIETVTGSKYTVFPEHMDLDFLLLRREELDKVTSINIVNYSSEILDSKLSSMINYHFFWEHANRATFTQMPVKAIFYTLIPDKEVYKIREELN